MTEEQLDIFTAPEPEPVEVAEEEPVKPRRTQITELPGETWEDIFGDPA